mgnify:CR=1 FL=1
MILVLFIFYLILSIILRTLMVAKWLEAAGNLNQQIPKGGFFNYVDKILGFFLYPITSLHWHFLAYMSWRKVLPT